MASAIRRESSNSPNHYVTLTHTELDICNEAMIEAMIAGTDIVINCAAYTNVESAEENSELAMRINRDGAGLLARKCNERGIKMIHISTDYVFGGIDMHNEPYSEASPLSPISAYGRSKAEGEGEVLKQNGVVVRTAWLYGPGGRNFLATMLRLGKERSEIKVVNDQHGTPTSALSLARALIAIVDSGQWSNLTGIYHYTDSGVCSWYNFAKEIMRLTGSDCRVVPCTTAEYPTKAARPRWSVLSKQRTAELQGITLRPWQEALAEVINIIKGQE